MYTHAIINARKKKIKDKFLKLNPRLESNLQKSKNMIIVRKKIKRKKHSDLFVLLVYKLSDHQPG